MGLSEGNQSVVSVGGGSPILRTVNSPSLVTELSAQKQITIAMHKTLIVSACLIEVVE